MGIENKQIHTSFGEDRDCYVVVITAEINNHGEPSVALLRAFLSREAFKSGASSVGEFEVEFEADVSKPIWPQVYAAYEAMSDGE